MQLVLRLLAFGVTKEKEVLEFRNLSWSTGMDSRLRVISHARRLASLDKKRSLKVLNAAVSGDEVLDVLDGQLPRLQQWSRENLNQEAPDYVTVLIGANDVCADITDHMTPTDTFHNRIEDVVGQILAKSPKTHVLVSSLPNIEKLRGVAKEAKDFGWKPVKTCEDVWKIVKLCPTITTLSDPEERRKVGDRVNDYNNAMSDVVEKMAKNYGDRVRYSKSTFDVQFTADDLAIDCFHPNSSGQAKLSAATWKDSWWVSNMSEKQENDLQKQSADIAQKEAKKRAKDQDADDKAEHPFLLQH